MEPRVDVTDWNERYSRGEQVTSEPNSLLKRAVRSRSPGRALDIACGAGRHAIYLASKGWDVTAVDSSRVGIDLLIERARACGVYVETHVADLERDEFKIEKESYDLISVFYYLQRDLFPKLSGGLRSGGIFVAAIHMVDESAGVKPMNPDFLLKPGELQSFFRSWTIEHYHETADHDADAGEHRRRSAEIIALKR